MMGMIVQCASGMIADKVSLADQFGKRFLGLMGKKDLAPGEGLLLLRCPAIHCFFMRFPIDAIYLNKEMKIVGMETIAPWRIGRHFPDTAHVLELPAGSCELKVAIGDHLVFNES